MIVLKCLRLLLPFALVSSTLGVKFAHFSVPDAATSTNLAVAAPTQIPTKAVGRTPALGWNSWNAYAGGINEANVISAAQSFITLGLKDAGYEYVNIDDCWPLKARDAITGQLVPDPAKFPNGIISTASQVHSMGLKFGIYSDAGIYTCAGYPGSLGHEYLDAQTWAEWGVDYLKYDNCNIPGNWTDSSSPPGGDWYNSNSAIRYRQMTAALDSVPYPIQFSLCIWGTAHVWTWGARVGHSWRMTYDVRASWSSIIQIIASNVNHLDDIDFYAHNDMDMMEIGNGDLTIEEQRTHFAAWCFLKSPILLGTDLTKLSSAQLSIITNPELLAFSQDITVGPSAKPFTAYTGARTTTTPPEYYTGKSRKGVHVFVINTSDSVADKTFSFANVDGLGHGGAYMVHDMWSGTDIGSFTGGYTVSLAAHDTAAFLISPED